MKINLLAWFKIKWSCLEVELLKMYIWLWNTNIYISFQLIILVTLEPTCICHNWWCLLPELSFCNLTQMKLYIDSGNVTECECFSCGQKTKKKENQKKRLLLLLPNRKVTLIQKVVGLSSQAFDCADQVGYFTWAFYQIPFYCIYLVVI